MPLSNLTDAQIHDRATDYALHHRVGYAEAVHCVVSFAEATAAVPPGPRLRDQIESDGQIDARARAYAIEHRVSYADALSHAVSFSEAAPLPNPAQRLADLSDVQIDAHARAYMDRHGVDYVQAVHQVASFAEAGSDDAGCVATAHSFAAPQLRAPSLGTVPMTDAELDTAARDYAARNGVDYAHALHAVMAEHGEAGQVEDSTLPDEVSEQDRRIDKAALAYVRGMGVSYSDALSHVIAQFETDFAEGVDAGNGAVAALQSQYIEIFRAGTHTDSSGRKSTFTAQDLKAIAASYDPARREAPLTLGHPDTDWPNYGRVKGLQATEDGRLLMLADRIDPKFAESVKAGRYRKRSASFYPPMAPGNPVPGHWYLRHVGWLGAQPPAVAGLADVEFATTTNDGGVSFGWV